MYWHLPGVMRFLRDVTGSLSSNKHVLIICPEPILRENLVRSLQLKSRESGIGEITIFNVGTDVAEDPIDAMINSFDLESPPESFEKLLEWEDRPSRIIGLLGIDQGDIQRQTRFAYLLTRAGEHAQLTDNPPYLILAIASPLFNPPAENVRFVCHKWWGVFSQVDVDLVTEETLNSFESSTGAEYYWGKALSRGIARYDPFLARRIVEEMPLTSADVKTILIKHSNGYPKPVIPVDLKRSPSQLTMGSQPIPPKRAEEKALWVYGWIDWCYGHGLMVHSTALALIGNERELERRIIAGQQEIILPLVESVRQALISWLESSLGTGWHQMISHGLSDEEKEAIYCEIAPLAHHLGRYINKRTIPMGRLSACLAHKWRGVRNQLAHGRMLSFNELESALNDYNEFYNSIST